MKKLIAKDTQFTYRETLTQFLKQKGEKQTLSYLFGELTEVCKVESQLPTASSTGEVSALMKKTYKYHCGLRGVPNYLKN